MKASPAKLGFNDEVISWLRSLGYQQAGHLLECIAKVLTFAEKNEDFFQGCGLYAVGSSVVDGHFNDIDIVLAGLDFRAVVDYDKIFLMDPETLIKEGVLVEPRCFVILDENKDEGTMLLQPVTEVKDPDFMTSIEMFGRMGLVYDGVSYDYNIDRYAGDSLNFEGFCSYHASPSSFTKSMHSLLCPEKDSSLSYPFDNYGFDGVQSFLVYHFPVEAKNNLPGVEHSDIESMEIKPIDFCIHAENLSREMWKEHQSILGLKYLTLKEWPSINLKRRIITDLNYPRFIDPNGIKRAKWDRMFSQSYNPGKVSISI